MISAHQVKMELRKAVRAGDVAKIVELGQQIVKQDLYLGEKAKQTGDEKFIASARFPCRCQHCGSNIAAGSPVYWGKGSGTWHQACYGQAALWKAGSVRSVARDWRRGWQSVPVI